MSQEPIVVIGAGLSGLAVAARLLSSGRDVMVLERSASPGGQISTLRDAGLVVELGAEGFVARSQAVPSLCSLLGIEGELVEQLSTDTYVIEDGRFVLLPPGEAARRLGFQVPEEELGRGIRSLARGMGQLIDALGARVGERLRLGTQVANVHADGSSLLIELVSGAAQRASTVVLATPAPHAAQLLRGWRGDVEALTSAPLLSNVSVNLLFERASLARYPAGSGVLFPERYSNQGLRALSLVNHKFAGRAPEDLALIRVFFRPGAGELEAADQHFIDVASVAIADVLGARNHPTRAWVSRWENALPVFTPAYRAAIAVLDASLQKDRVHLCGSAFHGAGIDSAAKSAEIVAVRLAGP